MQYVCTVLTLFHNYKTLSIRNIDIEDILGVNPDILNISFKKRKDQVDGGLRPSWQPDEYIYQRRPESRSPSPALPRRNRRSLQCPDIHYQFESFSRFGDSSMFYHLITVFYLLTSHFTGRFGWDPTNTESI